MKSLWRIVSSTRELWKFYIAVSFFSILVAVASQVQPLLIKGVIDAVTETGGKAIDMKLIVWLAVGMFVADLSQTIFSNIGGYIGDIMAARLRHTLGRNYFQHLLKLPQRYYDTELTGTILNRLERSIGQLTMFMQAMSNNFLQFIFSTIFSLVIVFRYSWQVGVLLLALYPVYIWLTTRTSKKWRTYQTELNAEVDRASGRFAETVGQMKVVKSFGREQTELKAFDRRLLKAIAITYPQSKLWHSQDILRRVILNVIFFGVFVFVFLQLAQGNYTVGTAVLLLQYAFNIRMPIFSISFIIDNAQRAISNSEEYFKAMDETPEDTSVGAASNLKNENSLVRFSDVAFGYDGGKPVLKKVSFTLKPNTKTALVGESGEGKTTITSLLLGFYHPQEGTISIGGQDVREVSAQSLRASIAVVFQDAALFSGTIRENIAYGRKGASRVDIEKASKAANAHEFISAFEKGYDTEIGERGIKLSGGQKQRIAIARALLKDAPILILDEATSSLDTRSERLVQQALERLMKNRTTLIIAHRLSTIEAVDTIITLKNGTIDEVGSPRELALTGGIYAKLLKLQQSHTEASRTQLKSYEMKEE